MLNSSDNDNSTFECMVYSSLGFNPPVRRSRLFLTIMLVIASINTVIAVVSSCSNFMVVYTISRTASLRRTPSNILILGLAISDLVVSFVCLPSSSFLVFFTGQLQIHCVTSIIFNASMFIFTGISLFTLTAITIDRFLAVYLHLRYQELVTTKRYVFALVSIWIYCACFTVVRIYGGTRLFSILVFATIFVVLTLNLALIFKICRVIRRHSVQIQAQQQSVRQSIDMPRYKKSVNTMYYVIGAFLVCYVPFAVVLIFPKELPYTVQTYYSLAITSSLVMFNGVLNPIIYFWRIEEIRCNAVRLLRKICNSNVQQMAP